MSKPEVSVTVFGYHKSGKSAIALLIAKALHEAGIEITFSDDNTKQEVTNKFNFIHHDNKLKALREKGLVVDIQEFVTENC